MLSILTCPHQRERWRETKKKERKKHSLSTCSALGFDLTFIQLAKYGDFFFFLGGCGGRAGGVSCLDYVSRRHSAAFMDKKCSAASADDKKPITQIERLIDR